MQYTVVVVDLDQHLASTTWILLTMLGQLISPTQILVTPRLQKNTNSLLGGSEKFTPSEVEVLYLI